MEMKQLEPKDLLDHSIQFDDKKVFLLDQIVQALYSTDQSVMSQANQILTEFQQDGSTWQYVDIILEHSSESNTKFIALNILENTVKNKWKALPDDQKNGIREYITNLIINMGKDESGNTTGKHLLTKLNETLVSIVKHEWTTTWKDFIPEICQASKTHQGLCENTMNILKLLSEEIFDFSKNEINSKQANMLKENMTEEFASIYELWVFVINTYIENSKDVNKALVKSCLKTFASFLSWIPFGYIFETDIMDKLLNNLFVVPSFRNDTLPWLVEIAGLKIDESDPKFNEYTEKQYILFCTFVEKTIQVTKGKNLIEEHSLVNESQKPHFEVFCLQLAMLLTEFLRNQIEKVETIISNHGNEYASVLEGTLIKSLEYLIQLTNIPNDELFKVMIEFWHDFTYYIMVTTKGKDLFSRTGDMNLINLQNDLLLKNSSLRAEIFPSFCDQIWLSMINHMAKPEEVLVVIDENGNAVEELITDSETVSLYNTMRANLVYLTNVDSKKVYKIMTTRLDQLMSDERNFTFDSLNKLCWALGSISECMMEDEENKFVVTVIKELLNLVEKKKGKNNKALVAADIMYVVGQFPRFLCTHWAFLKTVIKKLNEFMHEKHPGVQDMATEVFLKIAKKTKHMFVLSHEQNEEPYVWNLIRSLKDNTQDLEIKQWLHIYEGIAHMVSEEKDPGQKDVLLENLMQYTQADWRGVIEIINSDPSSLQDIEVIRTIGFVIKANERVAFALGHPYISHLIKIFLELLLVYKTYSENISFVISSNPVSYNMSILKAMRTVRREILNLIATFISNNEDHDMVISEFLPKLSELIVDYNGNVPSARDPEVLSLFTSLIKKMGDRMNQYIPDILNCLFESTLSMISSNYTDFMDFRRNYFNLIKAIVENSLEGLFEASEESFKIWIDSIIWGIKHYQIELADICLETMNELLSKVVWNQAVANIFFHGFYMSILQDTFFVLTDSLHKSGFYKQSLIIMKLIAIVEDQMFEGKLSENYENNKEFVIEFLVDVLIKLFANTNKVQIEGWVLTMFNRSHDKKEFVNTLRDFLIWLKEFAGNDQDDLYKQERDIALKEAQEKETMRKQAIPGLMRQEAFEKRNNLINLDENEDEEEDL